MRTHFQVRNQSRSDLHKYQRICTLIFQLQIMKVILLILLAFLFTPLNTTAQANYNVVFDLTSKDTTDQKNVMRWINEISKAEPTAKLEVVMYGQGLDLVVKEKSFLESAVAKFANNTNVKFKACAVAMKAHNIDKNQLINGVETVPDGIYEIVSKQQQGWGYIKITH